MKAPDLPLVSCPRCGKGWRMKGTAKQLKAAQARMKKDGCPVPTCYGFNPHKEYSK